MSKGDSSIGLDPGSWAGNDLIKERAFLNDNERKKFGGVFPLCWSGLL